MPEYAINVNPNVFNSVYLPYLEDETRNQIFYGGSGSGKSVFLAQRVVWDVLKGGRNYLICRAVGRTLRGSVFNEVSKVIIDWKLQDLFVTNKTEMTITCTNGYQIMFAGLDDVERLKSITPKKGILTDIWVEESTEVSKNDLKQLNRRLRGREIGKSEVAKRLTLSFNPILQSHHIYTDYFSPIAWSDEQREYKSDSLLICKTWYIHNRFLTEQDVQDLVNEQDSYYYSVYTLGNWGVLGNLIFRNWKVADLDDQTSEYYLPEKQRTNRRNGLDFGFSDDPAGLIASHYDKKRKRIYVYDELYEYGLTNDLLAEKVLDKIGSDPLWCDSSEPKSIAELRQHGVRAHAAEKGKDSVLHGIQWLQQQEIIVDKRCINMRNELQQYKWQENKNGEVLAVPVDKNNHLIDPTRYAYERDMVNSWIVG